MERESRRDGWEGDIWMGESMESGKSGVGGMSGESRKSRESGKRREVGLRRHSGQMSQERWQLQRSDVRQRREMFPLSQYMSLSQRVHVPIVPMIAHNHVSVMECVNVELIGGHFSFRIDHVLMRPTSHPLEKRMLLTSRDIVLDDDAIEQRGMNPVSTNQDTGSKRYIVVNLLHDLVPRHTNLSHQIPRWHLR